MLLSVGPWQWVFQPNTVFQNTFPLPSQGLDILCPSRRTVLLLAVVTCMGGVWTLEQPDGSVLQFYHTFRYFLASVQMAGGPYSVPS